MEAERSPVLSWLIELDAEDHWDLDLLVEHFRSRECMVTKDPDGKYYLTSEYFRGIEDHKEVIVAARPLMQNLNGIAKIIAPWFRPVNYDTLISVHENGNRGVAILCGPLEFRIPSEIPSWVSLSNTSSRLGKANALMLLAETSRHVADALRIFGTRPPTWFNLYNLYEIVREDAGGWQQIIDANWASESELLRFATPPTTQTS